MYFYFKYFKFQQMNDDGNVIILLLKNIINFCVSKEIIKIILSGKLERNSVISENIKIHQFHY